MQLKSKFIIITSLLLLLVPIVMAQSYYVDSPIGGFNIDVNGAGPISSYFFQKTMATTFGTFTVGQDIRITFTGEISPKCLADAGPLLPGQSYCSDPNKITHGYFYVKDLSNPDVYLTSKTIQFNEITMYNNIYTVSFVWKPEKAGNYEILLLVYNVGKLMSSEAPFKFTITDANTVCGEPYYGGWKFLKNQNNGHIERNIFYTPDSGCSFNPDTSKYRIVCDSGYIISGYNSNILEITSEYVTETCVMSDSCLASFTPTGDCVNNQQKYINNCGNYKYDICNNPTTPTPTPSNTSLQQPVLKTDVQYMTYTDAANYICINSTNCAKGTCASAQSLIDAGFVKQEFMDQVISDMTTKKTDICSAVGGSATSTCSPLAKSIWASILNFVTGTGSGSGTTTEKIRTTMGFCIVDVDHTLHQKSLNITMLKVYTEGTRFESTCTVAGEQCASDSTCASLYYLKENGFIDNSATETMYAQWKSIATTAGGVTGAVSAAAICKSMLGGAGAVLASGLCGVAGGSAGAGFGAGIVNLAKAYADKDDQKSGLCVYSSDVGGGNGWCGIAEKAAFVSITKNKCTDGTIIIIGGFVLLLLLMKK